MTTMMIRRCVSAVALGAVLMGVTSCGGGKKKQEEIDRLTEEVAQIDQELQAEQERTREVEEEQEKLMDEFDDLKRAKRDIESELAVAKREVERYEKREAMAKEREARENAREPSRAEKLAAARTEAEKHLAAVVAITGDVTSGSGFLVAADDKTWVYMAAGVLAGNTKLEVTLKEGGVLTPSGAFEVAGDAGLARLEVTDEVEAKLTVAAPGEVKSGLALLGVSDAGELVEGRCYGAENGWLRVDSRFSTTLPGAPVFHGETGALMAVILDEVAEKRELWVREERTDRAPKRAACRLDRDLEWTSVPIATFLEEAKAISDADRLTRLVEAFAAVTPTESGVDMSGSLGNGVTIDKFLEENRTVGAVGSLRELDKWLKDKGGRAAASDVERRTVSAYTEMGRTSGRHTATFAAQQFSPYHAKMAAQSLEWRRAAEKKLAELIKGLEK